MNKDETREITLMGWQEFETLICNKLSRNGWWALNIPRNKYGAQPFDIIAMKGKTVLMADCKVCGTHRFPLSRIEDNQWLSFKLASQLTDARIGIFAYYNDKQEIKFIPYKVLKDLAATGKKSVDLRSIK